MKLRVKQHLPRMCFLGVALLATGFLGQKVVADSVSFSPASGNALTPFTVTVEGFIGTNGPVAVSGGGGGLSINCSNIRPCTTAANMGYYSGKHWVVVSGNVDGVSVVVSNSFTVREAGAYLNRACGPTGTEVIVTGYDFARNGDIYVGPGYTQADSEGKFALLITIPGNANNGQGGPYEIIASDGTRHVTNEFFIGTSVCEEDIGRVIDLEGGATIRRPGGQPQPLNPGDPIRFGDEIRTEAGGRANVYLGDETQWIISENGKLKIDSYVFNPANNSGDRAEYSTLEGMFRYVSGLIGEKPEPDIKINIPMGNIGIRGTEFVSRRDPCSTTQEVYLIHGQLAIKPTYASVTNIVDAPATILFDATNVWTSGLTQAAYDALKNQVNQTNPVTFASWLVQHFGCTNDNPSATASADPDGDGQNNYAEFLSRTDPTTNTSVFRLVSGAREGDGVRLVWQTHGGITNVVQAAANLDGSYSNISPNIVIPGNADEMTNYFDVGIITNAPARYYRIRLAP